MNNLGSIFWEGNLAFGESTYNRLYQMLKLVLEMYNIIVNALLNTDINQNNNTIS